MSTNNYENGRVFAVLAYLLPVVGGLLGLAADGRNPLTRNHALQSIASVIALVLSFLIWAVAAFVIALIPAIGPILSISLFALVIALAAFLFVNWLVSFARALRGEERIIPIANRIVLRLFSDASADKRNA